MPNFVCAKFCVCQILCVPNFVCAKSLERVKNILAFLVDSCGIIY